MSLLKDLFYYNLDAEALTPEEIWQYQKFSYIFAFISLTCGILSVILIMRYTTQSMLTYRFVCVYWDLMFF